VILQIIVLHNHEDVLSYIFISCLFIYFGGTGIWTQGCKLAKKVLYSLSHASNPFCSAYFGDGVSRAICLDWPWIEILPISASQVDRITGVSHWCLVWVTFSVLCFCLFTQGVEAKLSFMPSPDFRVWGWDFCPPLPNTSHLPQNGSSNFSVFIYDWFCAFGRWDFFFPPRNTLVEEFKELLDQRTRNKQANKQTLETAPFSPACYVYTYNCFPEWNREDGIRVFNSVPTIYSAVSIGKYLLIGSYV
jgi:hypothetical protein